MRTSSLIIVTALLVTACGPVETDPIAMDTQSSLESFGQWQPNPNDDRLILDRLTLENINKDLHTGTGMTAATAFGDAPATETFLYIDPIRGLTVALPYNPNWGSSTYALPPYHVYDEVSEIRFGPLQVGEGGGYGRRYTLAFRPVLTAEAVAAQAEQRQKEMTPDAIPAEHLPRIMQSSGAMVEWVDHGLCLYAQVEVIGKTYNYGFHTCATEETLADELQLLRVVAGSVRAE